MLSSFVKVAKTGDLGEGQMIMVMADGEEVLLVRAGGNFYAIGNVCSHQEGWLDQGDLYANSLEVQCPLHEARFDLRTGEPTREPAEDPVPAYAVRVQGDEIFIGPPHS